MDFMPDFGMRASCLQYANFLAGIMECYLLSYAVVVLLDHIATSW